MRRERTTEAKQEEVHSEDLRASVPASGGAGLAREAAGTHPALTALVKLMARQAAREDALAQERDRSGKAD
ncbi:hypothetical protein DC363_06455 [Thalassorhabdomicrobium marinisediminis]|uniref:Uncharacterized protein n=1 Tax=Thalassorhabdomicrobium marinisediminis TaxID=2170577 RepID=A0A2T7FZ88_9RHOB|nr:hypothetical protein DC363_06455 [Thalassorhabdomicrobium marinisediminis]